MADGSTHAAGAVGSWWLRPLGSAGLVALVLTVCLVPAWLFADPLEYYYAYGDDWEFLASSRTFERAVENLWSPHNVHIVPVWRLWTALVVRGAGRLPNLAAWLAGASYAVHVAVMLLAGRLVTRDTRRPALGVATMVFVGTSSLIFPAATWYSASQASGAAFGVLLTLWFASGWRRAGGWWRLPLLFLAPWVAGGCWTTGHVAGPVASAYLLVDRRRRSRLAAVVPLVGSLLAVGVTLRLGAPGIAEESQTSFHGRKAEEAVAPLQGFYHTLQAVPERLLLGGLGLEAKTTFAQAVVVWLAVGAGWFWTRRDNLWPNPLEAAGLSLVVLSYGMLWSFRGYLPFSSLRGFMPWYETIPHVGQALFLAGWWAGVRGPVLPGPSARLSRLAAVGLLAAQLALAELHRPRCESLFEDPFRVPMLTESEKRAFTIPVLQRFRARYYWEQEALRQHRLLTRLDHAESLARRAGIGREALIRVYGRRIWPDPPRIHDANLLDLPWSGPVNDPAAIHRILGRSFELEPPNPRPSWPFGGGRIEAPASVVR